MQEEINILWTSI